MGEQGVQEGIIHAHLRASMADVLLPTITTCKRPVIKSRIQLQRDVFSPRVLSLLMSLEGTMVLEC